MLKICILKKFYFNQKKLHKYLHNSKKVPTFAVQTKKQITKLNRIMATSNFAYNNRCIVVTNDDYELDNIPLLGESVKGYNRNYPSTYLAISDDFDFWDIVLTIGYYEGACIDYTESDRDAEYFIGATMYYNTKKEFFEECKGTFHITEYRLRKVCGNIGKLNTFDEWIESAYEKLTDYLREREEANVNKCLDQIKQAYGYEEVKRVATMSNGCTIYENVG